MPSFSPRARQKHPVPRAGTTMPISEMTKLRLTEVKGLAQGHPAGKGQKCVPPKPSEGSCCFQPPSLDPFDPESKATS